jgi:hypothetical protein
MIILKGRRLVYMGEYFDESHKLDAKTLSE